MLAVRGKSARRFGLARLALAPWWACGLLAGDGVLIALDVFQRNGLLEDARFLVTSERGFGEWFQYGKGLALAAGLLFIARSRRSPASFALALIFGWVTLDDALMLHERAGVRLAGVMPAHAWLPLRPQDLAELFVLGAIGLAVATTLLTLWRFGPTRDRPMLAAAALGLLVLGFFGVGLDVAHALAPREHWVRATLAVIEDGGEMIVLSGLAATIVFVHQGRAGRRSRPLWPPAARGDSRKPAE
jgi:hypothetical protein